MHNIFQTAIIITGTFLLTLFNQPDPQPITIEDLREPISPSPVVMEISEPVEEIIEPVVEVVIEEVEPEEPLMSEADIDLIALVTMAEAEGESEEGQRLVIDTILNRVDSKHLGAETVSEVIYHPGQFTSMWNGRSDKCHVDEDIRRLVEEELANRTNSDVLYFHANRYSKYGTPMFSVGNHYFSS